MKINEKEIEIERENREKIVERRIRKTIEQFLKTSSPQKKTNDLPLNTFKRICGLSSSLTLLVTLKPRTQFLTFSKVPKPLSSSLKARVTRKLNKNSPNI